MEERPPASPSLERPHIASLSLDERPPASPSLERPHIASLSLDERPPASLSLDERPYLACRAHVLASASQVLPQVLPSAQVPKAQEP
jgi:hypothetical protein